MTELTTENLLRSRGSLSRMVKLSNMPTLTCQELILPTVLTRSSVSRLKLLSVILMTLLSTAVSKPWEKVSPEDMSWSCHCGMITMQTCCGLTVTTHSIRTHPFLESAGVHVLKILAFHLM